MRRGRKWQIECRKNNLNRQRQTAQKHVFRCATRRNASNSLVFLPIHYNPFRENTFFLCVCVYSLSRKREYRRQTSLTLGNTRAVRVESRLSGVIDEWIQGYCAKTSQKKEWNVLIVFCACNARSHFIFLFQEGNSNKQMNQSKNR